MSDVSDIKAELLVLKAENEKLRELVWRLLEIERIGATSSEWHEIHEAARELGVEVER